MKSARHRKPKRIIIRRPAKSILPPDVVDGGPPDRPILVRHGTVRYAATYTPLTVKANHRYDRKWKSIEVTIPREIAETAGWEAGMTICFEAYVDGRVRLFPAGDVLSREEEQI